MVEAGVEAYLELSQEVSSAFLVREIYRAMAAASANRRTAEDSAMKDYDAGAVVTIGAVVLWAGLMAGAAVGAF